MAALQQMCDIEQLPHLSSFKECPLLVHPAILLATHKATVNFRQINLEIQLPEVIVDSLGVQPTVCLLQYRQEGNTKEIYWREAKGDWAKISVNCWPKRIAAADGRLFLLGCRQLWIVGRDSAQKCLALEEGRVMDMGACLTEVGESGINIVYYSSRQGLFSREYSKSSNSSLWGRLRSTLHFSLKTHKEYSYFHIILPMLFAVAIAPNSIIIYDLDRMQQTNCFLPFPQTNDSQKPIIRWSFTEEADVLVIFVALGNQIYDFTLKLARFVTQFMHEGQASPRFDRIARGTAIDWNASHFSKGSFQNQQKKNVSDLCVFRNMIIIREEQGLPILPIYRIINLNDSTQKYSLISFESTLWREYYLDPYTPYSFFSKFQYLLQEDTCIREFENRKRPCIEPDSIFYLQACRNKANFRQFFILKGDLYLARTGMITKFEKISNLQAQAQSYDQQQRLEDEQSKLSKQVNRLNSSFEMRFERMRRDDVENEYREVMGKLKRPAQNQLRQSKECIPFANKAIIGWSFLNQKMRYYSQLIKYVSKNNIISGDSKKNSIISQLVFFLSGRPPQIHGSRLRTVFTHLFIHRIQQSLANQPSECFRQLVNIIFNNLLPRSFNISPLGLANNQYFQFLVQCAVGSESELMREDAQAEIKELISFIAPKIEDKVSPQFLRNMSFVRAYLISHPPPQELSFFTSNLLSSLAGRELYKQISQIIQFIPGQLETIIKSELCHTRNVSFDLFAAEAYATPATSSQTLLETAGEIKQSDCILPTKMHDHEQSLAALSLHGSHLIETSQEVHLQQEEQFILIYRSQLRLQQRKGTLQNVKLEQSALRVYLHLANRQIDQLINKVVGLQDLKNITKKISILQVSFSNFCKIIRKIYAIEPAKASTTYFEEVTRKMNDEETIALTWLQTGSQLLQGKPLSSIRLSVYRAVFSSITLDKFLSSECTFETLFKKHIYEQLSRKVLQYCEIDLLCYFLCIYGEHNLQVFLKELQMSSLKKIAAFYQKFELKDKIVELVQPLLEQNAYSDLPSLICRDKHLL